MSQLKNNIVITDHLTFPLIQLALLEIFFDA